MEHKRIRLKRDATETSSRKVRSMILKVLRTVLCCAASMGLLACGVLPAARDRPAQSSAPADPSTALALVVATSTPPGEHSGFRLMPLGVYSLDARLQLAKRAERSLVVQHYQLENDATGRLSWSGALIEAAERGVKVRIHRRRPLHSKEPATVTGPSRSCPTSRCASSTPSAAPETAFFHASSRRPIATSCASTAACTTSSSRRRRGRRRGRAQHCRRSSSSVKCRTSSILDSLVVGKVVPQLEAIFDALLECPAGLAHRRTSSQGEGRKMRMAMLKWQARPPKIDLPPADFLGYGSVSEELDDGRLGLLWGEARAIADPPTKPVAMTDAEAYSTSVTMNVWSMLMHAKVDVEMTSPYLVPGERGMAAFADLSRRKVKLTLLTNSFAANDEPLAAHRVPAATASTASPGRSGPVPDQPQGEPSSNERFGMFGNSVGRLHAKTAVVDSPRHLFIGSMNLDPRVCNAEHRDGHRHRQPRTRTRVYGAGSSGSASCKARTDYVFRENPKRCRMADERRQQGGRADV